MSIIEVGFGWLLGIGSNFIFRWYDQGQKIDEFRNGLKAELQEILPLLAGNVLLLKDALGEIDYNFLKWIESVLSHCQGDVLINEYNKLLQNLLSLSPEQLSDIMQIRDSLKEAGTGKGLKKFYMNFYENNMPVISFFPNDFQRLVFKIHSKLKLINQEIDRYLFFFDKTFDPSSVDVNKDILQNNMKKSYQMITIIAFDATNEIIKLLSLLKEETDNFFYNIKHFINKVRAT